MSSKYKIEERDRRDGIDLVVTLPVGLSFPDGTTAKTLHVRTDHGPRIGERVMIGRVAVKVLEKRYDCNGHIWLLDEDTRTWWKW